MTPGDYYFDEQAADKAVRFIQHFCRHFEGSKAGEQFILLDWQRDEVVRPLFGWKRRRDGLRKYRELYLISAKGAGKTPLLSAVGLYLLIEDGEAGPHVVSMASTSEQAHLTLDAAKKYVEGSSDLLKLAEPQEHRILLRQGRRIKGRWTTISGKPTGRSGPRPSCIIADEGHEWPAWTWEAFDRLCHNLFKRKQPLLLYATNAGESRTGRAYKEHERALRVLSGDVDDSTLLPVIYEAPDDLDWTSEAAAKAANPSLGTFVTFDQLAPTLAQAVNDPEKEMEYRRLFLSKWQQSGQKWLNLSLFDACVSDFSPKDLKDAALYVGGDFSLSDDLCAAAYVYMTPARMYLDCDFWVPRVVAEKYQHEGITYLDWAGEGWITLLDEPTVSDAAHKMIASAILERGKVVPIKAFAYDPNRASHCVAALDAAGVVCLATRQGWTLTPGCEELDRRLKEHSICIRPSPVLRAQAEVVEITRDQRGNYWPVKPNAQRGYAGRRGAKIDGIAAICTALVEARKHTFPKKASTPRAWII